MYKYFLVGKKFIVRCLKNKVTNDIRRQYLEVNKDLFDRAEKYGFTQIILN